MKRNRTNKVSLFSASIFRLLLFLKFIDAKMTLRGSKCLISELFSATFNDAT